MAIQWFPGHMHKARKEIKKVMPKIDLIIEVLDARIPYSSENPLIAELRGDKPCIKLLNKSDLADASITQLWIDHFQESRNIKALAVTQEQPAKIKQTLKMCRQFFPERNVSVKPIRVLIMGIPNVGKSTVINTLAGRFIAKVGDEPAITKRQQKIILDNGIELMDTPGFLWPKIHNINSGYRLAITGAIKSTAMEYEDVALYAAGYFSSAYKSLLLNRYKLDDIPEDAMGVLETIAKKRGCLQAGGVVNLHKVSEILLNEFRAKLIGEMSLETPGMIHAELDEMRSSL
ncbi:MAG: ribosome biogenesis GTPase YlqF [endosymbiont of Galathealinum brachiosum]|uniref:Ribosome biogenesis GTPase A n=1 Tax=endosymbiont of Galathealinum brachiosum TaxID=2200906 RepID=A0A370DJE2_9GAMM|nr:MAG: ribosome biogenesis GTPase YlqF [endosymbiont of Galathealinum brachiosum]